MSDVDLMVLNTRFPDEAEISETKTEASQIAEEIFGETTEVDLVFMEREEFLKISQHSINNVAARARREGTIVPRDTENYSSGYDENYGEDGQLEYQEREGRIADANENYRDMHTLLDAGNEGKNVAFHAQQAIEHAMKALVSAFGDEYNPHHKTLAMARDIRRKDPADEWRFASNLGQLDNFAGRSRYGPVLTPIQDYREMANDVTEDLDRIYERINSITGEPPWDISPEGSTQKVQRQWRRSP